MFDFLKGGKANLKLEADSPNLTYTLGETVHIILTVEGVKDLKIQKGLFALVCKEEYEYRYESRSTDSEGNTETDIRSSWGSDERKVFEQAFLGETTIRAGSTQTFQFEVPLPSNAPPTCAEAKIVRVHWWLKATLDRKLAADVEAKTEIRVLTLLAHGTGPRQEYGRSNEFDQAEMVFALPGGEFALGETVSGQLVVRPKKSFDVSGIRLELVEREYVPRDEGNVREAVTKVKLADKMKLQPGQDLTYPFSVAIPANSPVTIDAPHSSVTWFLRGVLDRPMRGDTRVEGAIQIFSARSA
jgi:sporulation-control protein spo0M